MAKVPNGVRVIVGKKVYRAGDEAPAGVEFTGSKKKDKPTTKKVISSKSTEIITKG